MNRRRSAVVLSKSLAQALERLRNDRWVPLRALVREVGITAQAYVRMTTSKEPMPDEVLERIKRELDAPVGWPEVDIERPAAPVRLTHLLTPEEEARNETIRPVIKAAVAELHRLAAALEIGDVAGAMRHYEKSGRILRFVPRGEEDTE